MGCRSSWTSNDQSARVHISKVTITTTEATYAILVLVKELDCDTIRSVKVGAGKSVKTHTILTEDSLEAKRTQFRAQLGRGGTKHVVLDCDSHRGDQGDDEEVQRIAVTVVATLVGVGVREAVDSLAEDNTKRWVDSSGHCRDSISFNLAEISMKTKMYAQTAATAPMAYNLHASRLIRPMRLKR